MAAWVGSAVKWLLNAPTTKMQISATYGVFYHGIVYSNSKTSISSCRVFENFALNLPIHQAHQLTSSRYYKSANVIGTVHSENEKLAFYQSQRRVYFALGISELHLMKSGRLLNFLPPIVTKLPCRGTFLALSCGHRIRFSRH